MGFQVCQIWKTFSEKRPERELSPHLPFPVLWKHYAMFPHPCFPPLPTGIWIPVTTLTTCFIFWFDFFHTLFSSSFSLLRLLSISPPTQLVFSLSKKQNKTQCKKGGWNSQKENQNKQKRHNKSKRNKKSTKIQLTLYDFFKIMKTQQKLLDTERHRNSAGH